jgi:anti-anti-sigma factor
MEQFKVSHNYIKSIPVIFIEGDMTSESEEDVFSAFDGIRAKEPVKKIIFDFTKTNYINSAGIATLISVIETVQKDGGVVAFSGLSNHFMKVMDIVGISDFARIFDTVDLAVADFI